MTLSLAEWLELEQMLSRSRKARRMFRQRAARRLVPWRPSSARQRAGFFSRTGHWVASPKFQ